MRQRALFILACSFVSAYPHAAFPAQADSGRAAIEALYERGGRRTDGHWRPLGKTHQAAVFLHADARKTADGHVSVWRSDELPFAEYLDKEYAYLSVRNRLVVDCAGDRVGVSARSYHGAHFGTGPLIASVAYPTPEWSPVIPDSLEEDLLKTVCAPKPRAAARKSGTK